MKMDNSVIEDIKDKALDVLDAQDVNEPVVNAVAIAKKYGVDVKEIEMPSGYQDVAGFYDKQEKTIYVAKSDKPSRKSFTVAHELGHVILGHKNYDVLFRVPRDNVLYSKEESEANIFAANLLMPEFMVRDYMKKYNLDKGDYKRLAEIFGVPIQAMKNQLGYV